MPAPAYHPLVRALGQGLRKKCGVGEGAALLLAVSGGADSVALLRACALLAPRRSWRLRLGVAHVHHGMRQAADEEARFVEALATDLGLPFYRADLDASAFKGRNLEEAMRQARYGALARIALAHGFPLVAAAHHADDQLETLLLRLCRGCRPEALAGMAWRREWDGPPASRVHLIRPLLGVEHADALDFLRTLGQDWREDAGNADEAFARAKLRLKVIPVLKELHPQAARKAAALAEAVQDGAWKPPPAHEPQTPASLSRALARTLAPADLRLRLKALLHAHGVARVNAALLAQLAHMAADHHGKARAVDLPGGKRLVVTREDVRVKE